MVASPYLVFSPQHLMDQRDRDARSGAAERVPKGNSPSVDVEDLPVEAQFLHDCQTLSCKCLVELDEADIVEFQSGPLERLPGGRNRADAHDRGIDAGDCPPPRTSPEA